LVGTEELRAWGQHSEAAVDVQVLPGGHFYLRDAPEVMLRELRPLVRRYAEPRPVRWESSIW
jgi:surfactin synthase thioesterase subunit